MNGLVYINYGRVITDCPANCGAAFVVAPGQRQRACNATGGCGAVFSLVFPDNLDELLAELSRRPEYATKNWFPAGHPLAVKAGLPSGQSVADLRAEFDLMTGAV